MVESFIDSEVPEDPVDPAAPVEPAAPMDPLERFDPLDRFLDMSSAGMVLLEPVLEPLPVPVPLF